MRLVELNQIIIKANINLIEYYYGKNENSGNSECLE